MGDKTPLQLYRLILGRESFVDDSEKGPPETRRQRDSFRTPLFWGFRSRPLMYVTRIDRTKAILFRRRAIGSVANAHVC